MSERTFTGKTVGTVWAVAIIVGVVVGFICGLIGGKTLGQEDRETQLADCFKMWEKATINEHDMRTMITDKQKVPASPAYEFIEVKQPKLEPNKIEILIEGGYNQRRFVLTNESVSMNPCMDSRSTGVMVTPKNESEIQVGSIVAFRWSANDGRNIEYAAHRVVETGKDDFGWYAWTQGDNNLVRDPFKIRFVDVQGLVVATIFSDGR